jgi:hypothetical protein
LGSKWLKRIKKNFKIKVKFFKQTKFEKYQICQPTNSSSQNDQLQNKVKFFQKFPPKKTNLFLNEMFSKSVRK